MSKVEHTVISSLERWRDGPYSWKEASLVYKRRGCGVLEIKLGGSTFPNKESSSVIGATRFWTHQGHRAVFATMSATSYWCDKSSLRKGMLGDCHPHGHPHHHPHHHPQPDHSGECCYLDCLSLFIWSEMLSRGRVLPTVMLSLPTSAESGQPYVLLDLVKLTINTNHHRGLWCDILTSLSPSP